MLLSDYGVKRGEAGTPAALALEKREPRSLKEIKDIYLSNGLTDELPKRTAQAGGRPSPLETNAVIG